MFKKTVNDKPTLQTTIDDLTLALTNTPPSSETYDRITDQLVKLETLHNVINVKKSVSPDTLAVVLGNLLGIVVIVGHERANVVTSKALNFVMKASH